MGNGVGSHQLVVTAELLSHISPVRNYLLVYGSCSKAGKDCEDVSTITPRYIDIRMKCLFVFYWSSAKVRTASRCSFQMQATVLIENQDNKRKMVSLTPLLRVFLLTLLSAAVAAVAGVAISEVRLQAADGTERLKFAHSRLSDAIAMPCDGARRETHTTLFRRTSTIFSCAAPA